MIPALLLFSQVSLSGVNVTNYWLGQPGWTSEFKNEAEADLYFDDIRLGARFLLDAENLRDTLTTIGIRQRYLSYAGEEFELWLGNYYRTLGQGLVLSGFEDKALRVDRNLDGGYARWEKGWFQLGALAGRMLTEDKVTRSDWIYAAEVGVQPADWMELGGIYLRRDATQDADTLFGRPFEEMAEENLALRLWRFDFNAAAAQRFTWGRESADGWIGVDNVKGLGFYGSLSYSQPGVGLLLEAKDYRGLDAGINAPPPANPDGESINQGADEQGLEAVFNASPWDGMWLEATYSSAWDSDTADRSILNRYGLETRLDLGKHTLVPFFTWIDREIPGALNPENDRIEGGLEFETLVGQVFLHLEGFYRRVTEAALEWDEPHLLAEVGFGSWMLSGGGAAELREEVELWPWGSVRYNAYPFDVTLSYGKFKGEYICKNGVCAYELPFRGLKADLTLYF